jgi:hypothetical protein
MYYFVKERNKDRIIKELTLDEPKKLATSSGILYML